MESSGIFISFEGTEGSGKSTLIRHVFARLESLGHAAVLTREPGGSPMAEKTRKLILENPMAPMTELFLYEAARAEHLAQTILPALGSGKIVLCDRFTDSTLAYQAYARGLPWKTVQALNKIATQGVEPHLVVFLDIDPETGLKRAQDANRFEAEGVAFQTQVRKGFLKSRSQSPRRWLTLKIAQQTPEQLADRVLQEFAKRFSKKLKKGRPSRGSKPA